MVFGKLGELGDLLKVARKFQEQMKEIQAELQLARFETERGGVRCVVSGDMELKQLTLEPSLLQKNQKEIESRVAEVVGETFQEAKREAFSKFKRIAGALPIPGLF